VIRAVGNQTVSLTDSVVLGHSTIRDNTIKTPFTAINNVDNLEYSSWAISEVSKYSVLF
jgi:hypothetical protein